MKKDKNSLMNEWVSPNTFPFIITFVEKFENGEITLTEVYKEIDTIAERLEYMNKPLYERFNLAYFLRNESFPNNMITIPHEAEQGKWYGDGICIISQRKDDNTIIWKSNEFILTRVR